MFQWKSADGTEHITSRAVNWIIMGNWPGLVTVVDPNTLVISGRPECPRPIVFHRI